MAVEKHFVCDIGGLSTKGVLASTEDGETVEVPPPGWVEVTIRRVFANTTGLAEADAREAMREQSVKQAVDGGMDEAQAQVVIDTTFPPIDVPEFIVTEHEMHVSPKYAERITSLFDFDGDDEDGVDDVAQAG